jgi:segregation and condensation protein B
MDEQNLDRSSELEDNANLNNIVMALLFASDEPLSVRRMSAILEDASGDEIKKSIEQWRRRLDEEAWSIAIEQVAGGYQLITRVEYAPFVGRLYSKRRKLRLSRAGLETLAIIAYKQPVTRADVENVRGVSSGGVIANLMERALVKITGKARVLGAPFLYGTTPDFLEYLGLNSLKDLPSLEELEALLEKEAYPEGAPADAEGAVEEQPAIAAAAEDSDELFEATAVEVASAMAAVNEARASLPKPPPKPEPAPDPGTAPPESADPTAVPDAEGAQEPTVAESVAGAATIGPVVEEPVNQPLGESQRPDDEPVDVAPAPAPLPSDDGEDTDADDASAVTFDEREDDR